MVALTPPKDMALPAADVAFAVADAPNDDGSVDIAITASAVAMYATFTTLAHGRFSDNAILLLPGATTIQFIPFGALQIDALRTSLRVEHVATYL